jgi:hypothetical protein
MVNCDQIPGIHLGYFAKMASPGGGPAGGEICDGCGKPITKQQFSAEGIASTLSDMKRVQFHVRCFQFWDTGTRAPKT